MITTSVTATAVKMPIFRPGKLGSRRGTTIETTRLKTTRTRAATPMMTSLRLTGAYDNPSMSRAGILVVAGGALLVAVGLTLGHVGEEPGALPNWQALMLGIVQGRPSSCPSPPRAISSSSRGSSTGTTSRQHDEFNQTFDVALHLGTLGRGRRLLLEGRRALIGPGWAACGDAGSRRRTSASRGSSPSRRSRRRHRRARRELHRRPPRRAVADRDLPGLLRRAPLVRRPDASSAEDERPRARHGRRRRLRAEPRAHARRLALGDHDHGGPLPRARPRLSRTRLVPPPHPDHVRRRALEGSHRRPARRPAARLGRPLRGRCAGFRGERPRWPSGRCSATCAGTPTRSSSSTGSPSPRSSSS